jgi:hypothetical protein
MRIKPPKSSMLEKPPECTNLTDQRLNPSLESGRVGADDVLDLLAVLEEHEGGHGADAELGGDLAHLVDVDLVELGLRVVLAELGDLGRDRLARAAPGREAVEHNGLLGVDHLLLELGLAAAGVSRWVRPGWVR